MPDGVVDDRVVPAAGDEDPGADEADDAAFAAGDVRSLLFSTRLSRTIVQDPERCGQVPSWGGGELSSSSEARSMPAVLSRNVERSIVSRPPASMAVKAMTLCSAVSWSKTALQSVQPPM